MKNALYAVISILSRNIFFPLHICSQIIHRFSEKIFSVSLFFIKIKNNYRTIYAHKYFYILFFQNVCSGHRPLRAGPRARSAPPLIENYKPLRLAPEINIGTFLYVITIHANLERDIFLLIFSISCIIFAAVIISLCIIFVWSNACM